MRDPRANRMLILTACLLASSATRGEDEAKQSSDLGTIHVPAFELPVSSFLSPRAQETLRRPPERATARCRSLFDPSHLTVEAVKAMRACLLEADQPRIERMQSDFAVDIRTENIAGVPTEIFTPRAGVSRLNKHRVLINLHGGGFIVGSPRGESIPIAGIGRIKVIGVSYRMGPEHRFPAASEDVAAVYRQLLDQHSPVDIGVYGCSAGGRLTAQSMVWFQKAGIPAPGAIGLFSSGAAGGVDGDSAYIGSAIAGINLTSATASRQAYFGENPDFEDPLLVPLSSPEAMARFPSTLLISATRDYGLSNIVRTHAELVKRGVPAELHVWEGLGHCFFYDPELPESREAYDAIVEFFAARLGKAARSGRKRAS